MIISLQGLLSLAPLALALVLWNLKHSSQFWLWRDWLRDLCVGATLGTTICRLR